MEVEKGAGWSLRLGRRMWIVVKTGCMELTVVAAVYERTTVLGHDVLSYLSRTMALKRGILVIEGPDRSTARKLWTKP